MPSMGVGTSDADGDVEKVLRSLRCSPSLTPSQAAMTLQRWFRQVRAGQQARRLLALLALMSASQQANNNNGSVCAARALPDVCVMCCVLDSVEDYAAAVDVENYTRRLLCEENLPATSEAWRQASSSVRRQLRQKHPRLRRICLLPAKETSGLVAGLIVQLSVPRETHKEDEDDCDTGTLSWIDVDARMHTLLGETATDWLAAQPVPSKHTVKTSDVHNALQAWVEWRTHRQSHSSYEKEAVVEDAALLRDVPPLPPPHRRSPSADTTAEADVNSQDMLLPPRPLRGEQSGITAADDAAEKQDEEREVEEWLHDESDGNDDDDEMLQSTEAQDLATRLAAADEAALHRRNTRFYAAQKAKEAALSKVLAHRLGLEKSVGAEVRPSKDDEVGAHDSAPGDAVLPIFGRGADQIRSPCLGSACVTDLRSSPPHTVSCVCAVCELDGVWADAAEAEDALVRCAACGIPLHQTCAVTSEQGEWVCSRLCAGNVVM